MAHLLNYIYIIYQNKITQFYQASLFLPLDKFSKCIKKHTSLKNRKKESYSLKYDELDS